MLQTIGLLALLSAPAAEPRIELYTMGQGEHVFERFGHAAICVVYDRTPARSRCYNYGTTDFGSPPQELGWDFLRGRARFWVSVWSRERMLRSYEADDRTIWRQRLPLSGEQVGRIQQKLEHDAREENRYYLYHHFYDNCTTRLRDIVDDALGGSLSRRGARAYPHSFRRLGRAGLAEFPPVLVAGDLLVGRDADRTITFSDAMFLPDVLRSEIEAETGAKPELVYRRQGRPFASEPPRNTPWQLALALVCGLPLALARWAKRGERAAAAVSGVLLGVLGLLVWLVAAISSVPELRVNEVLLVFWPTDLLLGVLKAPSRRVYAKLRLLVLVVLSALSVIGVLVQPLLAWIVVAALPFALVLFRPQEARASSTTEATA